jgi:DNA-binding MarR family transcriptional regulator
MNIDELESPDVTPRRLCFVKLSLPARCIICAMQIAYGGHRVVSTASHGDHEGLLEKLMRELRLMSSFDALFSHAVAERTDVHATDIETMDLLNTLGTMTAGELSQRTGLTSGATTRLIDRLVRKGYVRRKADETDRRRVLIEPIYENLGELETLYGPMAEGMTEIMDTYSDADLSVILDFVRRGNAHVARINAALRAESAETED